jgi:hypothetical protein
MGPAGDEAGFFHPEIFGGDVAKEKSSHGSETLGD